MHGIYEYEKESVWFGLMAHQPIVGYLMPNSVYSYILNIYNLVWFGFIAHQPLPVI